MTLILDVLPKNFYLLLINEGLCMYSLDVKYPASNKQAYDRSSDIPRLGGEPQYMLRDIDSRRSSF